MRLRINSEEPYGKLISNHINRTFPKNANFKECELVEAISNILIGTKEYRYGCLPVPEHLVTIRKIIRLSIQNNKPIPILIPWGGVKSDFFSQIDVAELVAIQRLVQINEEVKQFYPLGLDIVVRIEDLSGYSLFSKEKHQKAIREAIDFYSQNLVNLFQILDPSISLRLETKMINEHLYMNDFNICYPKMLDYLIESEKAIETKSIDVTELNTYKTLTDFGWQGIISYEQRQHYYKAYQRLYPDITQKGIIERLALYFTGSLAKKRLLMSGAPYKWKGQFIQLTFVPPVEGLPEGYDYHYVYQRTLPLSEARTHIPPWRGKGYLSINGNEVKFKITSFGNKDLINQLIPATVEVCDDNMIKICKISADYLLVS